MKYYNGGSLASLTLSTNNPVLSTWYEIEIDYQKGAGTGSVSFYLNDVQKLTATGLNNNIDPIQVLVGISEDWTGGSRSSSAFSNYIDCVDVATTHIGLVGSTPVPTPLSASITPTSSSIQTGQSTSFTVSASGGTTPYTYQWYVNNVLVSGQTGTIYGFSSLVAGSYSVYAKVTDSTGTSINSNTATVTVTAVSPPPVQDSRYGVCFGNDVTGYHAPEEYTAAAKSVLTDLANAGAFWMRVDWINSASMVSWKTNVKTLGAVHILGILDYWTMNMQTFTLAQWQDAVRTAVQSAPDVEAWEIWNEPDLSMFQLGYMDGTPQHYYDMLTAAYTIIKSINPNALVVGPALSSDTSFLQSIINLGALNYLDAVSVHMYQQYGSYDSGTWNTYKSMVGIKPLWITETGYSTYGYTEVQQNVALQQELSTSTGFPADKIFWYELMNYITNDWEGNFGIVQVDGTPKLAYSSFKAFVASQVPSITPTTYVLTIQSGAGGTTSPVPGSYSYSSGSIVQVKAVPSSGYVFVSWSGGASGTNPTVSVIMDSNKNVKANFKVSTSRYHR